MAFAFVIDSREKRPYLLDGSIQSPLKTGDYSLKGMEAVFAIERKSHDDIFACLTSNLPRFKRQLKRLGALKRSALLLDTTVSSILLGHPMCRLPGEEALKRILCLSETYGVPVYFCDRKGAEVCRILLSIFYKETL